MFRVVTNIMLALAAVTAIAVGPKRLETGLEGLVAIALSVGLGGMAYVLLTTGARLRNALRPLYVEPLQ